MTDRFDRPLGVHKVTAVEAEDGAVGKHLVEVWVVASGDCFDLVLRVKDGRRGFAARIVGAVVHEVREPESGVVALIEPGWLPGGKGVTGGESAYACQACQRVPNQFCRVGGQAG